MDRPRFMEHGIREREVPYEEKQQLFLLAAEVILAGDAHTYAINEAKEILDTNKLPAHFRQLTITADDQKWLELKNLGVSRTTLTYWPERTSESETLQEQINVVAYYADGTKKDHFVMKLYTDEQGKDKVRMGNRTEMDTMGVKWMEISREDANKVNSILSVLNETLNPGLAAL